MDTEKAVYHKLMREDKQGRARGFGFGVFAKDLRNAHHKGESQLLRKVLHTMQTMLNQINALNARVASQAATAPHESVRTLLFLNGYHKAQS